MSWYIEEGDLIWPILDYYPHPFSSETSEITVINNSYVNYDLRGVLCNVICE